MSAKTVKPKSTSNPLQKSAPKTLSKDSQKHTIGLVTAIVVAATLFVGISVYSFSSLLGPYVISPAGTETASADIDLTAYEIKELDDSVATSQIEQTTLLQLPLTGDGTVTTATNSATIEVPDSTIVKTASSRYISIEGSGKVTFKLNTPSASVKCLDIYSVTQNYTYTLGSKKTTFGQESSLPSLNPSNRKGVTLYPFYTYGGAKFQVPSSSIGDSYKFAWTITYNYKEMGLRRSKVVSKGDTYGRIWCIPFTSGYCGVTVPTGNYSVDCKL